MHGKFRVPDFGNSDIGLGGTATLSFGLRKVRLRFRVPDVGDHYSLSLVISRGCSGEIEPVRGMEGCARQIEAAGTNLAGCSDRSKGMVVETPRNRPKWYGAVDEKDSPGKHAHLFRLGFGHRVLNSPLLDSCLKSGDEVELEEKDLGNFRRKTDGQKDTDTLTCLRLLNCRVWTSCRAYARIVAYLFLVSCVELLLRIWKLDQISS